MESQKGMLVLTRRVGESIIIDGEIKVEVLKLGRGQVSIGIKAPSHVSVNREEIQRRIDKGESQDSK